MTKTVRTTAATKFLPLWTKTHLILVSVWAFVHINIEQQMTTYFLCLITPVETGLQLSACTSITQIVKRNQNRTGGKGLRALFLSSEVMI
jgi:hypothetical protein